MANVKDVAKYFLTLNDEEIGELISNLKLQKLVYYAQGFYLAINDKPLFTDTVEAWAHGPVIPNLYHAYRQYESGPIPIPDDFDVDNEIDGDTKDLLDEVYKVFGQFSAWKLRNMTHEEPPWKEAWETNKIISNESMKVYFKTLINS